MKRRKWFIWGLLLLAFSGVRLALTYYYMDKAVAKLDIDILQNFEYLTWALGAVFFIVAVIGIIVAHGKIIKDMKNSEEAKQFKYSFPLFILIVFVKSLVDIYTINIWNTNTFYLAQDIQKLKGEEILLGHPSGLPTMIEIFLALLEIIFAIVFSLILKGRYKKYKK